MTRLYALPSWLFLIVACAVAVSVSTGGQRWVHRRFRQTDFLQHNEVGGFMIAVVGTLYAVTLAFVVSIVWQEYDGSASRVAAEVAGAATAWQIAVGLPEPLASQTRATVAKYAQLMIDQEWPAMRHGGFSKQGEGLITGLLRHLAAFRPVNAGESNVQAQELRSLEQMHDLRHQRLNDNASGISAFQWVILVLGATIVIGFCFLFGLSNKTTHDMMTGAVACIIAATFVLIFELDYPFYGDLGISSEPWRVFLQNIGP